MAICSNQVSLKVSLPKVKEAINSGALIPFFKKSTLFKATPAEFKSDIIEEDSHRAVYRARSPWSRQNLRAFGFCLVSVEKRNGETLVNIAAEKTTYAKFIQPIVYFLGLLLCGIGIIFPYIGFRNLRRAFSKQCEALMPGFQQWAEFTRSTNQSNM